MSPPILNNRHWQQLVLVASVLAANVSALNYTSIADIWPDMADLPSEPRRAPHISYAAGGLSFQLCCKIALNESVQIEDGRLSFVPGQTFLHGDPQVFAQYPNPCIGAAYTGYEASVQQGTISYSWCAQRCPGWSRIEIDDVNSWVQQLLAYCLPAAIFSTNIPRRWKIRIPSQYFPRLTVLSVLSLAYKLPIATVLAAVDVVWWLVVVFCLAGPMMLSGLYHSLLDHKVIRQLTAKKHRSQFTFQQRCHLAMILPLGNLDHEPAWDASVSVVRGLPDTAALATDSERLVGTKIRMLLQTQQEFGAVLGIGVLFFISSFIYACLELQDKLGGSIFSHNLAFGIFWMVVPHVAIVANTALTSSDLTSLDLMVPEHTPEYQQSTAQLLPNKGGIWHRTLKHFGLRSRNALKSAYTTAWQWDQGRCKQDWLEKYLQQYPVLDRNLGKDFRVSYLELAGYVWLPALVMLLVPCALGCLISVTTPLVGIACKSIIPIVYFGAQICLMTLWQLGVSPTTHFSKDLPLFDRVLGGLYAFFAFAAGVASIGGTIAVDVGLTNNCLCWIPMHQWMNRFDPGVRTFIGPNVDEGKYYASNYWLTCGISGVAFLFAIMYFGWWWTRYLWTQFYAVCDEIRGTANGVQDGMVKAQSKTM